jgi:hypothetical protein
LNRRRIPCTSPGVTASVIRFLVYASLCRCIRLMVQGAFCHNEGYLPVRDAGDYGLRPINIYIHAAGKTLYAGGGGNIGVLHRRRMRPSVVSEPSFKEGEGHSSG